MKTLSLKFYDPIRENLYFQKNKADLYRVLVFQTTVMDVMSALYIYFSLQRNDYFGIALRSFLIGFSPLALILSKRSLPLFLFFSLSTHFLYSAIIVETSSFLYRRNIEEMFWLGYVFSLIITVSLGVFRWYYQAINLFISFIHTSLRVPGGGALLGTGVALILFIAYNLYAREKHVRHSFLQAQEVENQRQLWEFVVKEIFKSSIIMIKPMDKRTLRSNNLQLRRMTMVPIGRDNRFFETFKRRQTEETAENLLKKRNFEISEMSEEVCENFNISSQEDVFKFMQNFKIQALDGTNLDNASLYWILTGMMSELDKEKAEFLKVQNKKIKGTVGVRQIELHLVQFKWKGEPQIILKFNSEEYLKKKIDAMKKLDMFKDQFLASITHDLRTPLFGVEFMIESADSEKDDAKRSSLLSLAKMNLKLLMNLVNDILDYSQIKEKKFHLNTSTFNLASMIAEVLSLMKIQAEMKHLKLEFQSFCEETLLMTSDSRRLKQVLINLISNSIKFTERGTVTLRVAPIGKNLIKMEVIDSGAGIKPEVLPLLTKPYSTFDSGSGLNREGIGLGLFNCKNIIGRLGPSESLHISSKYGSGSKFGFLVYRTLVPVQNESNASVQSQALPLGLVQRARRSSIERRSDSIVDREEEKEMGKIESVFSSFESIIVEEGALSESKLLYFDTNIIGRNEFKNIEDNSKKRFSVLIVDDNPFNTLVIQKFIEKVHDFQIKTLTALHGKEAIKVFDQTSRKAADNPVKIIFMDCRMPIMNGFEASKQIKTFSAAGTHVEPHIVGLTSFVGEEERELATTHGMDELHLKPISESEFIDLLRRIAARF